MFSDDEPYPRNQAATTAARTALMLTTAAVVVVPAAVLLASWAGSRRRTAPGRAVPAPSRGGTEPAEEPRQRTRSEDRDPIGVVM